MRNQPRKVPSLARTIITLSSTESPNLLANQLPCGAALVTLSDRQAPGDARATGQPASSALTNPRLERVCAAADQRAYTDTVPQHRRGGARASERERRRRRLRLRRRTRRRRRRRRSSSSSSSNSSSNSGRRRQWGTSTLQLHVLVLSLSLSLRLCSDKSRCSLPWETMLSSLLSNFHHVLVELLPARLSFAKVSSSSDKFFLF
jgi:hypothetical protein